MQNDRGLAWKIAANMTVLLANDRGLEADVSGLLENDRGLF